MHITIENDNGLLTLSTVVEGFRITQKYPFISESKASSLFRDYVENLTDSKLLQIERNTMENLQVTGVRYFRTNRGLAYTCTTNIKGVTIENDGNGGGTYTQPYSSKYTELELEELINQYEGIMQ